MSSDFINGARYAISTVLGPVRAITGTTNASPPAIASATMPANDDIILLSMASWSDLNEQATYTDTLGHLFELDTTNVKFYPPGEGQGSYRDVSGFTTLSQVRAVDQAGGDANTFNYSYIEDRGNRQRSKPTDTSPVVLTFTLDRDPTLPWFDALDALSKSRQLCVMRETLESGEQLIYTGYVSFQKSPTRVRNENMTVTATFSINSEILAFPATFPSGS